MPRRAAFAAPPAAGRCTRTRRRHDRLRRADTASRLFPRSDRRCGWDKVRPYIWRDSMAGAVLQCDCMREHRPRVDAGVELAILAARIDGRWQIVQQRAIEVSPHE